MPDDDFIFEDEPLESLPLDQQAQAVKKDLYEAMSDNTVDRRWKKQAIARILDIDEAVADVAAGDGNETTLKKAVRRAGDLLNQLNRY